jgi:hypothetical protein
MDEANSSETSVTTNPDDAIYQKMALITVPYYLLPSGLYILKHRRNLYTLFGLRFSQRYV